MRDSNEDSGDRVRRDPRRDPTDPPPPGEASPVPGDGAPARPGEDEPPPDSKRGEIPAHIRSKVEPARPGTPHIVTINDPRIPEIEAALATSDWDHITQTLGPAEDAGRLPPNLGIIYAVAMKERERAEISSPELTDLAIRCSAGLFGVDPASPFALILAKRLLRKNPVAWQKKPAPPPTVSILIIVVGLAVGALIGWLVSFGYIRFSFH